jgi:hypothetical protein
MDEKKLIGSACRAAMKASIHPNLPWMVAVTGTHAECHPTAELEVWHDDTPIVQIGAIAIAGEMLPLWRLVSPEATNGYAGSIVRYQDMDPSMAAAFRTWQARVAVPVDGAAFPHEFAEFLASHGLENFCEFVGVVDASGLADGSGGAP